MLGGLELFWDDFQKKKNSLHSPLGLGLFPRMPMTQFRKQFFMAQKMHKGDTVKQAEILFVCTRKFNAILCPTAAVPLVPTHRPVGSCAIVIHKMSPHYPLLHSHVVEPFEHNIPCLFCTSGGPDSALTGHLPDSLLDHPVTSVHCSKCFSVPLASDQAQTCGSKYLDNILAMLSKHLHVTSGLGYEYKHEYPTAVMPTHVLSHRKPLFPSCLH